MKTMILGQKEVIKLLPMDECLDLMEQTFRQQWIRFFSANRRL